MKQIRQFRYYGEPNEKNYPRNISTYGMLSSGNIFKDLGAVTHIGIQAAPGTQFYLNGSPHPFHVGATGIYELDLSGIGAITSIRFSKASLNAIEQWPNGLFIDVLCEGAGL